VTQVRQSSAIAGNDAFRLDERAGFRGRSVRYDIDLPRLCRTLRPAPQAGCFVSRLYASYESRVACDSFAFGTVMVAPSSGVSEPAEQAKARAELKSKGRAALATGRQNISFTRAGLCTRPSCTQPCSRETSSDPVLSAYLKHPVNAFNNELLDLSILV
jgi:hypothetical protein